MINCKIELNLKWTKYCVLSAADNDNDNDNNKNNCKNIIFSIKDTKLNVPVVTLSARDNQNCQNFLVNDLKDQFIGMNIKQKGRITLKQRNTDIFLNQILLESMDYLTRRYCLPKDIKKNYNVIINGKNFSDQTIDSDIKQYEEIRKLTKGQGEDYATGCLLNYKCIKNRYRLIAVDLSRQKELDTDPKAILQIEFVGQLTNVSGANAHGAESIFILTILEKIKEMRLNFFQRSVTVL